MAKQKSICLKRTRKRLANLVWGVLFLLMAPVMMAYGLTYLNSEPVKWAVVILSAVLGLLSLATGLYECVAALKDALFPGKSKLAKSIRSQLPYPQEDLPVEKLFAPVDKDISENGVWFDRVAVGKEWILGDEATYIPRVRAVFGRDEIQKRRANGTTVAGEVVQIYIIDDRKQVQMTRLKNPNELKQLIGCLRLTVPDALFLPYDKFPDYASMSREEWDKINLEYRNRKARREMDAPVAEPVEDQSMVFTRPDGTNTSRLTQDMVLSTLHDAIFSDDRTLFTLSPTVPFQSGQNKLTFLQCCVLGVNDPEFDEDDLKSEAEIYLITGIKPQTEQQETGFALECEYETAQQILLDWLNKKAPDVSNWLPINISSWQPPQERPQPRMPELVLESSTGVLQSHDSFEREDVEIAAEGLENGSYKSVELTLPGGYLTFRVEPGDKTDGRCSVTATNDVNGKLRFYTVKCSQRQASQWLMEYYDGKLRPYKPDWKDITNRVYKRIGV